MAVTALIASAASFVKMNVDAAVVAALVFDLADPQAADLADAPSPPPYPVGTPDEEYYSGMRAAREWKEYFCIKRDYTGAKSVLK